VEYETIELKMNTVRQILASGSGDAALLYLALRACDNNEGDAAAMTGFSLPRLRGAREVLKNLSTDGRRNPVSAPMEESEAISGDIIAQELEKKGGFYQFVNQIQRKLDMKLTTPYLAVALNMYQNLGLSPEVLYLLITYCMEDTARFYGSSRKPTLRQLEKEAYHWVDEGLDTPEKAEEFIRRRRQAQSKVGIITNVLGISDRRLSRSEDNYITRWVEWGFGAEEIELAYDKTMLKTGQLNWKYLNQIVTNWHSKGLLTLEAIKGGDKKPETYTSPASKESFEQEAIEWAKNYRRNQNAD